MMKRPRLLMAVALLALTSALPAAWTVDGGYTTLNIRGLSSDHANLNQSFVAAPFPYTYTNGNVSNGDYVGVGWVMDGVAARPGLRLEYLQSQTGLVHLDFDFIGGHYSYNEIDTISLLPLTLGVNPLLWSAKGFELSGRLYTGYAFASDVQDVAAEQWFFTPKHSGLTRANGGNFIAEGGLGVAYHLGSKLTLGLDASYRQADIGTLTDSSGKPMTGWADTTIDFDMSGWKMGGSMNFRF